MPKIPKSKQKYHVKVFTRTYDDDGILQVERLVHEQDTWALSERQAVSNARHNSGLPYHGNAAYDGGRWFRAVECEVVKCE